MLNAVIVMVILGAVMGLILYIASIKFAVPVDERLAKTIEMLPGLNCGACGYPGCSGMAEAMLDGSSPSLTCPVCKPEQRQAIINYLNSQPGPDGQKLNIR